MKMALMFASFILSCLVVTVCFTKKRLTVARAAFWAVGLYVFACSVFLLILEYLMPSKPDYWQLTTIVTYMLAISTVVFDVVSLVISVAGILLCYFAIKKIVEYFRNKRAYTKRASGNFTHFAPQRTPFFIKKLFILNCRLQD